MLKSKENESTQHSALDVNAGLPNESTSFVTIRLQLGSIHNL